MARNKTNYYGKAKKKSGAVGIIVAVTIAALLLGAAVGVMGYGTSGFKDWGFSRFAHKTPAAYEQNEETTEETGGMDMSDGESYGIGIVRTAIPTSQYAEYGISPIAETAVQITATITPAEATYTGLTWTVKFVDNSGWAEGKSVSDYVTLDSFKTGGEYGETSQSVNVSCLKAFSKQIQIKVVSDDNPEKYATCTVDYVQRLLNLSIVLKDDDGEEVGKNGTITPPQDLFTAEKSLWASTTFIPTFSEGTIVDNNYSVTYKVYSPDEQYRGVEVFPTSGTVSFNQPLTRFCGTAYDGFMDLFGMEINPGYPANSRKIYEEKPPINIDVTIKGGKSQNPSKLYTFSYKTDWKDALYTAVSGLNVGKDNIVF